MQIKFKIEDEVSILKGNNYAVYLDSYLEVFHYDEKKETLLFSTTMHSTILIEFSSVLIRLYQTEKKQTLDPFGNASVYSFTKSGRNLYIINFDELSNDIEWEYKYDLIEFIQSYTKELKHYLDSMVAVESDVQKNSSYKLLEEKYILLKNFVN